MNNAWFYDDYGQTRGPVHPEDLVSYLKQRDEWRAVLVWKEGFADWKHAVEVDELSRWLTRPPPLPRPRTPLSSVPKTGPNAQATEPAGLSVQGPGPVSVSEPTRKKGSWALKALGWMGLFVVACLARGIWR
jgi:hypothetical protein